MADDPTPTQPSSRPTASTPNRRSSFAGQTLADLFGANRSASSRNAAENSHPSSISQAAAQAQRRRISLTTLGLSGSPNQMSPFNSFRGRGDSLGSANSGSNDESAIAEGDGPAAPRKDGPAASPNAFGRRASFGARAMRERLSSSSGAGSRSPGDNASATSNPGFNWSDNLRTRVERTTSVSGPTSVGGTAPVRPDHDRAKSVAVMEAPPPPTTLPPPKVQKRPDHFQERILKGDFYMD